MMLQTVSLSLFLLGTLSSFPDDEKAVLKRGGFIKNTSFKTMSTNRSPGFFPGDSHSERKSGHIWENIFW